MTNCGFGDGGRFPLNKKVNLSGSLTSSWVCQWKLSVDVVDDTQDLCCWGSHVVLDSPCRHCWGCWQSGLFWAQGWSAGSEQSRETIGCCCSCCCLRPLPPPRLRSFQIGPPGSPAPPRHECDGKIPHLHDDRWPPPRHRTECCVHRTCRKNRQLRNQQPPKENSAASSQTVVRIISLFLSAVTSVLVAPCLNKASTVTWWNMSPKTPLLIMKPAAHFLLFSSESVCYVFKWYIRTTIKHFDMKLELAID